jgi:hypothetical protein
VIGAAVKVMRIATGEETEEVDFDGIDGGGNSAVEAALPSVQPRSSRGTSGWSLIVAGARTPAPVLCL